jgi:hypothetical protein
MFLGIFCGTGGKEQADMHAGWTDIYTQQPQAQKPENYHVLNPLFFFFFFVVQNCDFHASYSHNVILLDIVERRWYHLMLERLPRRYRCANACISAVR